MIGRAAQGRRWVFREIDYYLKTGMQQLQPLLDETREIMLEHLQNLFTLYGECTAIKITRKHVDWYLQRQPETRETRRKFNQAESAREQLKMIREYIDSQCLQEVAA